MLFTGEDDPRVRTLARRALESLGYTVLEAASGVEAIVYAQQYGGSIDLLLRDMVMPQMGGRELAERLATARPGLRVLFVSGVSEDVTTMAGMTARGVQMPKPFTRDVLAHAVRRALEANN